MENIKHFCASGLHNKVEISVRDGRWYIHTFRAGEPHIIASCDDLVQGLELIDILIPE